MSAIVISTGALGESLFDALPYALLMVSIILQLRALRHFHWCD